MASRYTSFMLIPAWLWRLRQEPKLFWAHAGLGLALAWAPMLLKNWLLVGYPLAPLVGDPSSLWFWRVGESARNLSWTDVAFYPFVWTFGDRPMMLGNLSPLFLGLAVPWLLLRRHPDVWRVRGVLALGVSIVATWVAVEPRALHTRYLLVGVGVMAVGLAPAFVALDDRLGSARGLRLAGRTGLMALVGFWVLVSSWTALEAGRYAAGLGRREDRYRRKDGADVAEWLNQHVARGERVSLLGYGQYRYLLRTDILESSETREELEKAWVAIRSEPQAKVVARLAMDRGFRHVVGRRDAAGSLAAELPAGSEIAFGGAQYVVMTLPR